MSKQSELAKAYRSARANYLRNIRSMQNRGYVFDKDPIPKIPKRITEGSIRNIQRLNQRRYNKATRNGLRGQAARTEERREAAERAKLHKEADEARITLNQLGGAMVFEVEQATPGGSTEVFLKGILNDVEGIIERAEDDDAFAISAANVLEENWDEVQKAIEILEYYKDVEDAPGELKDRLIEIIREAEGRTITKEDMMAAGTIGETPDYYPKE